MRVRYEKDMASGVSYGNHADKSRLINTLRDYPSIHVYNVPMTAAAGRRAYHHRRRGLRVSDRVLQLQWYTPHPGVATKRNVPCIIII